MKKIIVVSLLLFSYSCANNKPQVFTPVVKTEILVNTQKSTSIDALSYITQKANEKKVAWLKDSSSFPSFTLKEPKKTKRNKQPILLSKGEFETTQEFKKRVLTTQQQQLNLRQQLDSQYQSNMRIYNNTLKKHQLMTKAQFDKRIQIVDTKLYPRYIQDSVVDVLGSPILENIHYNVDIKHFFATLTSEKGNLKKIITFYMPLDEARNFKKSDKLKTKIEFRLSKQDGLLSLSKVDLFFNNKSYTAKVISQKDVVKQKAESVYITSGI